MRRLTLLILEDRTVPAGVTPEVEPNNSLASANAVTVPTLDVLAALPDQWLTISGSVSTGNDVDFFRFSLANNSGVFFDIDSREVGLSTTLDSILTIFDAAGAQVSGGTNDDGYDFEGFAVPATSTNNGTSLDASLYLDLPAGTYTVRVSAFSGRTGSYLLRLLADSNYAAAVPAFDSNPGAADTLYLDFNGHSASDDWGTYTVLPFDFSGNGAVFSPGERLAIRNIWRVVAEDYSPFAINVTTVSPASFANGVAFRHVITNSNSAFFDDGAGDSLGIAFRNSYINGDVNTAFTFATNFTSSYNGGISGTIMARAVEQGNTTSHEFGHALGLRHFGGSNAQPSGIMQTPDTGLNRETWRVGLTHSGEDPQPPVIQDDMAIISNATNTFGYRPDDHGNSIASATTLTAGDNGIRASGVIAELTDVDFFRVTASGTTTITANVDEYVNNLDVELFIYDSAGNLVASSDPTNSFDATLTMNLTAGTYYLEVRSDGEPGEAGQYQLSVTSPLRTVQGVTVDDGSAQRSRVTSLTVAFSGLVDLPPVPAGAFQLTRLGPGGPTGDVTMIVDLSGSTATQTIARLTFSGVFTEFGSLIDGNYTLTVIGSQVTANGQPLDGDGDGVPGGNFTLSFFRFFGDVNGDRFVNGADFALFRTAFGTGLGDPNYNAAFDLNGDGFVNGADFAVFRTNFGSFLNP